jgi:hypothetical protein
MVVSSNFGAVGSAGGDKVSCDALALAAWMSFEGVRSVNSLGRVT